MKTKNTASTAISNANLDLFNRKMNPTSKVLLENFDINDLDDFSHFQYTTHHIKFMPKIEALQVLINTVEGDYSQLCEGLAEIALLQEKEDKILYEAFETSFNNNKVKASCKTCMFSDCSAKTCAEKDCDVFYKELDSFNKMNNRHI